MFGLKTTIYAPKMPPNELILTFEGCHLPAIFLKIDEEMRP